MNRLVLGIGYMREEYLEAKKEWLKYKVNIELAESAEEAVQLLSNRDYACVVFHTRMLEFQPYIEALRQIKTIPILVVSPKYSVESRAQFIFQYLLGSKNSENNLDRIKDIDNYIDHIDTNKPLTVITDKDLCVCLEQRVVQVSGIEINFTRQEFDALYLLLSNRKRVMTFKMISIFVWGEEYADVSSKVVSNLISRVRQKLRIEANSQDYIKSIHGIGYKFDP